MQDDLATKVRKDYNSVELKELSLGARLAQKDLSQSVRANLGCNTEYWVLNAPIHSRLRETPLTSR